MKKYSRSSQEKMSISHYKGVPSDINRKFISRRVDSAFISSISAKKYNHLSLGIVAKEEVLSVLVIPHVENKKDVESASSNALVDILELNGRVIIGDKALKYYLDGKPHIDLAKEWHKRYNLPFVFALLCFHKDKKLYKDIERKFLSKKVKIPQYLLEMASKRTDITKKDIVNYLTYISYDVDYRARRALKLFYKKS